MRAGLLEEIDAFRWLAVYAVTPAMYLVVAILSIALGAATLSHAGFRFSGGSYVGSWSGGLGCVSFSARGQPGRPRQHGVICGITRRGTDCRALTGPSQVFLLSRRGDLQCAAPGDLRIEGRVPGAFALYLSGKRCGVGDFRLASSGGNEVPRCPARPSPPTLVLGPRPPRGVGKRFTRGRLRCVVLSNDELRRHDPGVGNKDAVFCIRRTASEMQGVSVVFVDGAEELPGCDLRIDPATGCGSAADCGLPDLPICP